MMNALRRIDLISKASRCTRMNEYKWNVRRCIGDVSAKKKVMITTPIFYVNSSPHIGHLYTSTLADSIARYHRLLGKQVHFMTGTDEHGLKIQQAAEKNGFPNTLSFCDKYSNEFLNSAKLAGISFDDFIRTTEDRHSSAVKKMWNTLLDKGFIKLGKYEGWYSVSDEAFIPETQTKEMKDSDGNIVKVSTESGHKLDWVVEDNYKFALSQFQKPLQDFMEKNPNWIVPTSRANQIKAILNEGLEDLSVSRIRTRASWGISVPNDSNHTIYVWLDALTNYLTSAGYPHQKFEEIWPADYQVIGKDIVKFHAIYWPAFLMAAGLELPKKLVVHAHWLVNKSKMSKSIGNVVAPKQVIDLFGLDAVRFFLLCEGGLAEDGDFSMDRLFSKTKGELADNYGNLVGRVTSSNINPLNMFPSKPSSETEGVHKKEEEEYISYLKDLKRNVEGQFEEADLPGAVSYLLDTIRLGNRYFQLLEPWKIASRLKKEKEMDQSTRNGLETELNRIIYNTLEGLRMVTIMMQPVMPESTSRILDKLGIKKEERTWETSCFGSEGNHQLQDPSIPFKAFQIPDYNPST